MTKKQTPNKKQEKLVCPYCGSGTVVFNQNDDIDALFVCAKCGKPAE